MSHIPSFWALLKKYFDQKQKMKNDNRQKSVTMENNGRSAFLIYNDGGKSVRLYSEFGGGKCIFYSVIPNDRNWEAETGFPLSEKLQIIEHIAKETIKKHIKNPGAYFEISEQHILFKEP